MICPNCSDLMRSHIGHGETRKGQFGRYMFWKCVGCDWIVKQKGDGWLAIGQLSTEQPNNKGA